MNQRIKEIEEKFISIAQDISLDVENEFSELQAAWVKFVEKHESIDNQATPSA